MRVLGYIFYGNDSKGLGQFEKVADLVVVLAFEAAGGSFVGVFGISWREIS